MLKIEYDTNEVILETALELNKEALKASANKKEGISPAKVMYKIPLKLRQARTKAGIYK